MAEMRTIASVTQQRLAKTEWAREAARLQTELIVLRAETDEAAAAATAAARAPAALAEADPASSARLSTRAVLAYCVTVGHAPLPPEIAEAAVRVLIESCSAGDVGSVQAVLGRVAALDPSLSARDAGGWTGLMCAIGGPAEAWGASQRACAQILLEAGADIEAADPQGRTALIIAVRRGNLDATQLLLDWGADPYTADVKGESALQHAIATGRGPMVDTVLRRLAAPVGPAASATLVPVVRCHIDRMQADELAGGAAAAADGSGAAAGAAAAAGSESDAVSQALKWSVGYLKQRSAEEEFAIRADVAAAQEGVELSIRAVEETKLQARQRAVQEAMARASARLPPADTKVYR